MIATSTVPRKPYKLDQLGFVGRGKSRHRPRDDERLYGGAHPFFQTGDVKAANLLLTQYSQTYNDFGLAQSKLWDPGTLCITIAANIAETAILGVRGCFPDSVVGFVADPAKADTRFIKYYVDTIKLQMQSVSRGTTQDNLSVDKLLSFDFLIPCLSEQRRIAGILSAYDDLIENCQRRIRILEDMARGLYREWFVNFRFPGAEAVPLVDSPLGPIPTNWCAAPLRQLTTKIGSGATPRGGKEAYGATGLSLIRSLNVYDYRFEFGNLALIDDDQAAQLSNVKVEPGDVLLNITGASVARCSMVPSHVLPARVNQHVAIVRANRKLACAAFLLDTINNDHNKQRLLALAQGGATREALTKNTISEFLVVVPPFELVSRYGEVAQPMHDQRDALQRKCQNLRRTRDLLLPRLLSGQISLGEATEQAQDQTQATAELADSSLVG